MHPPSLPPPPTQVRLADGALGSTRLARAQASLALSAAQQLSVDVELAPAEAAGHVRLSGALALTTAAQPQPPGPATPATPSAPSPPGPEPSEPLDMELAVRDSGMMLLAALLPDVKWLGGSANVAVRARGPLAAPVLEGSASVARGSLSTPFTKQPLTNISGMVKVGARAVGLCVGRAVMC
jgi:autotransporter translocation and assembly factor TamB